MKLTNQGKIQKKYRPAVYFDASVVIDYWLAEGGEMPETEIDEILTQNELPHKEVLRRLMKADRRYSSMVNIRERLLFGDVNATAVVSPLALMELVEWHAESVFKDLVSDAVGVRSIQRKSKKDIGALLFQLWEERKKEAADEAGKPKDRSTGLELLVSDTMLNPSFALSHGLQGLSLVDLKGFSISSMAAFGLPFILAYGQLGMADILHILAAIHLGCDYIASFDSDFARANPYVKEETGITLLATPESIIEVLDGTSPLGGD